MLLRCHHTLFCPSLVFEGEFESIFSIGKEVSNVCQYEERVESTSNTIGREIDTTQSNKGVETLEGIEDASSLSPVA